MAIYQQLNHISEFEKIGSANDVCRPCAIRELEERQQKGEYSLHIGEVENANRGKYETKRMLYTRQSGLETCICEDCIRLAFSNLPVPRETEKEVVE